MTETAAQIAERTADAYMADAYGETEWESCAQELLNRGLTSDEAEAVLRSKAMRWADDGAVTPEPSADAFRHYLDRPEGDIARFGGLKAFAQSCLD